MIPVLPVNMVPAAARAASPAAFVLAVVIGLAVFAAAQNKQQTQSSQPR